MRLLRREYLERCKEEAELRTKSWKMNYNFQRVTFVVMNLTFSYVFLSIYS